MNRVILNVLYSSKYVKNGTMLCTQSDAIMRAFDDDPRTIQAAKMAGLVKIVSMKNGIPGSDLPCLKTLDGVVVAMGVEQVWNYLFPPIRQTMRQQEPKELNMDEFMEMQLNKNRKRKDERKPIKPDDVFLDEEPEKPPPPRKPKSYREHSPEEQIDDFLAGEIGNADTEHTSKLMSGIDEDEEIYL